MKTIGTKLALMALVLTLCGGQAKAFMFPFGGGQSAAVKVTLVTQYDLKGGHYAPDKTAGALMFMSNFKARLNLGLGANGGVFAVTYEPYKNGTPFYGGLIPTPRQVLVLVIPDAEGFSCNIIVVTNDAARKILYDQSYTFSKKLVVAPPIE